MELKEIVYGIKTFSGYFTKLGVEHILTGTAAMQFMLGLDSKDYVVGDLDYIVLYKDDTERQRLKNILDGLQSLSGVVRSEEYQDVYDVYEVHIPMGASSDIKVNIFLQNTKEFDKGIITFSVNSLKFQTLCLLDNLALKSKLKRFKDKAYALKLIEVITKTFEV